jgi:hypothetical protein
MAAHVIYVLPMTGSSLETNQKTISGESRAIRWRKYLGGVAAKSFRHRSPLWQTSFARVNSTPLGQRDRNRHPQIFARRFLASDSVLPKVSISELAGVLNHARRISWLLLSQRLARLKPIRHINWQQT